MAKKTVVINIQYKNDNWETFNIPADEAHAEEMVDIGVELGKYKGGAAFLSLVNNETGELLFVNLEEIRSVHMKTKVTE